jgi:hypothetical protein
MNFAENYESNGWYKIIDAYREYEREWDQRYSLLKYDIT